MKNLSNIIVTVLVVVCSVILLAALIITVQDNPFSKPVFEFSIDLEDAPGIKPNSQVAYAGQVIGKVEEVQFLKPEERPEGHPDHIVRLHIDVLRETPLPKNIKPTITASSLLGGNLVTLQRVDDEGGMLETGAQLIGHTAGPLDALAPGATEILDGVNDIVVRLNEILGDLGGGDAKSDVTATLSNVREITETINTTLGGAEGLEALLVKLNDAAEQVVMLFAGEDDEKKGMTPQFHEILENVRQITVSINESLSAEDGVLANLESAMAGVDETVNGPDGEPDKALQQQIETLTSEIQVLLVYAQYFTGSLAEKPRRLLFGDNDNLNVPTKETIIDYIERTGEAYPVEDFGSETEPEDSAPEKPRRGLFNKR
ncbi:MAG: MlaD family protein [Verrucomicrobiota bacterium]